MAGQTGGRFRTPKIHDDNINLFPCAISLRKEKGETSEKRTKQTTSGSFVGIEDRGRRLDVGRRRPVNEGPIKPISHPPTKFNKMVNIQRPEIVGGAIVVVAKCPIPGSCKTRLVPMLGNDGAANLARAMLSDVLSSICGCVSVLVIIFS